MHALVLFRPGPGEPPSAELDAAHVSFIVEMAAAGSIVMGGEFDRPAGDFAFAYVIRCGTLEEAEVIAASEPYVRADAFLAEVVEWRLVGIVLDAFRDVADATAPDW
ncbi:YciI family protein [Agromyces sp. SYSU K20354]|uniref:YciI family protein n=1 Tax=Agromyces cavernae TaxID=2898659 RepID=UPI001E3877C1|nr:YciI family protein [Agromyces cavernae]MCD2442817.1 YciI family protein [Agromyces cavernae]